MFNDPALDSLIQTAYRQNLDLKAAATRVLQAQAERNVAAGNLLPQTQNALGAYAHAQLSKNALLSGPTGPGAPQGIFPNTLDLWTTGLNASWELDFWGRIRRGVESANAARDASVEDYRNALVALTGEAATAYVQIRTFQQRIAYARRNVDIQKGLLDIVEARVKDGRATGLDLQQARANLAQTEATIPQLEIGLRRQDDRLCVLLGLAPGALARCLREAPIPTAPPEVAVGVPADLLSRRPEVRAAEREAAAQSARIGVAEADFYPRIGVTGFIGYTADDGRRLFDESSFTGLVLPNFQWKILNYGRVLNNVREQDARFRERVLDYQRTVLTAGQEVEDALVGFLQYQVQARDLERGVEAARKSVDIVQDQYQEGRADFNRVFTTEAQLVTQQDQLAVARGNIAVSLIAVYRALGGGWKVFEKGPPAQPCATPAAPDLEGPEGPEVPEGETWTPAAHVGPARAPGPGAAGDEAQ